MDINLVEEPEPGVLPGDAHVSPFAAAPAHQRIPPELICEIILLVVDKNRDTLDVVNGPWALTQISRLWRESALSYTGLWTSISIDLGKPVTPAVQSNCVSIIKVHFDRSAAGNLPVSIKFVSHKSTIMSEEILDSFISHSHHWGRVDFHFHDTHLLRLNRIKTGALPQLQQFRLNNNIPRFGGSYAEFPYLFSKCAEAPQLLDLTLRNFAQIPTTTLFPWAQLRSYAANYYDYGELSPVLHQMAGLVELTLSFRKKQYHYDPSSPAQALAPNAPPFYFPALRKVHFIYLSQSLAILDTMVLPSLEDLRVDVFTHDLSSVSSLIRRSHCSLTTLDITGLSLLKDDITPFLRSTPSIVELRLSLVRFGATFASTLIAGLRGDASLPHLQHLSITGRPRTLQPLIPQEVFVDMIRSRLGGAQSTRLRSFTVTLRARADLQGSTRNVENQSYFLQQSFHAHPPSIDILPEIRAFLDPLRGDGLQVSIAQYSDDLSDLTADWYRLAGAEYFPDF